MPDLFISYSRKDIEFVRRLHTALNDYKKDAWVDWDDIPPSADWINEIYRAIEASDAYVFVLSADSLESEVCAKELAHALGNQKHIVPILYREIDDGAAPPELAVLNWLTFREQDEFASFVQKLVEVLDTDLEWVQAHTRLLIRAREWESNQRNPSFLIRGSDLDSAERWLSRAERIKGVQPTPLQVQYLLTSRQDATRRQRLAFGATLAALLIIAVLALLTFQQYRLTQEKSNALATEVDVRTTAENNEKQAKLVAQAERNRALAGQLAAQSQAALAAFPQRSLLLALEAMAIPQSPSEGESILAHQAMMDALANAGGRTLPGMHSIVNALAFSPDERWLAAAGADGLLYAWDLQKSGTSNPLQLEGHQGAVNDLAFTPDGAWLVSAGEDATLRLWPVGTSESAVSASYTLKGHSSAIKHLTIHYDNRWLAVGDAGGEVSLWDLAALSPNLAPIWMDHVESSITTLAFSPDGQWLAYAGNKEFFPDNSIRLYPFSDRGASGSPVLLSYHPYGINRVVFSPDSAWLASSGDDNDIALWRLPPDLESRIPHLLKGHSDSVTSLDFSPDGNWLASGSEDSTVRLWKLESNGSVTKTVTLNGHTGIIHDLSFNPDGAWLASGSGQTGGFLNFGTHDNTVRIWDSEIGLQPRFNSRVWRGQEGGITSLAFSKQWLALGTPNGVRIWDLQAGRLGPDTTSYSSIYIGKGSALVYGVFTKNGLEVYQLPANSEPAVLPAAITIPFEDRILNPSITLSPQGNWLGARVNPQTIYLYHLSPGAPTEKPFVLNAHTDQISTTLFDPQERWLLTSDYQHNVYLWDLAAPDPSEHYNDLKGNQGWVESAAFSPDGRWLAIGDSWTLRLWDLADGVPNQPAFVLEGSDLVKNLQFSPDGRWLSARNEKLQVWPMGKDGLASKQTQAIYSDLSKIQSAIFSPRTGRWLVVNEGKNARLLDMGLAVPAAVPFQPALEGDSIATTAFSPDEHWLAAGTSTGIIYVWDLMTQSLGANLRSYEGLVTGISFSPDGRWLASSNAQDVRLWDLQRRDPNSSQVILDSPQPGAPSQQRMLAAIFSVDSRWLITTSLFEATLRLWPLKAEDMAALACSLSGRNFTDTEWQLYFPGQDYRETCSDNIR